MLNRKNTQNPQTLRRILRYIRPYLPLVVLSLVLSVLTVALTLYVPILTGHAVDAIAGENLVDFQTLFRAILTHPGLRASPGAAPVLCGPPLLRRSDQPDHHGY